MNEGLSIPISKEAFPCIIRLWRSSENSRLKVLRAATEQRNFHKAAGRPFLTHPPVTLQFKALKSDLGARLFDCAGEKVSFNATRFRFADVRQRSRGNGFRSEYSVSPRGRDAMTQLRTGAGDL